MGQYPLPSVRGGEGGRRLGRHPTHAPGRAAGRRGVGWWAATTKVRAPSGSTIDRQACGWPPCPGNDGGAGTPLLGPGRAADRRCVRRRAATRQGRRALRQRCRPLGVYVVAVWGGDGVSRAVPRPCLPEGRSLAVRTGGGGAGAPLMGPCRVAGRRRAATTTVGHPLRQCCRPPGAWMATVPRQRRRSWCPAPRPGRPPGCEVGGGDEEGSAASSVALSGGGCADGRRPTRGDHAHAQRPTALPRGSPTSFVAAAFPSARRPATRLEPVSGASAPPPTRK